MTEDQREIRRKQRGLEHACRHGDVSKACRYFGVGRSGFYRWRVANRRKGEAGLVGRRSVPHNPPNKTPAGSRRRGCICGAVSPRADAHRLVSGAP